MNTVTLGCPDLDFGIGTLPKVILRFYRYLRHEDQPIPDRLMLMVIHVLALFGHSLELRTSDLPMNVTPKTLENWKSELRSLGLLFTRRLYYPPVPGRTPRIRTIEWDLSSLLFNCRRVGAHWIDGQHQLDQAWAAQGAPDPRPIYQLPDEFSLDITLPLDVARRIVADVYDPRPNASWLAHARSILDPDSPHDPAAALAQFEAVVSAPLPPTSRFQEVGVSHFPIPGSGEGALPDSGKSLITYGTEYANAYSGPPPGVPPSPVPLAVPVDAPHGRHVGDPVNVRDSHGVASQTGPAPLDSYGIPVASHLDAFKRQVDADLARLEATGGNSCGRLTNAIAQLIGLEHRDDGSLRSIPHKSDYAAIGALARDYGPRRVWTIACRLVGRDIRGQPIPYLRSVLMRELGRPSPSPSPHPPNPDCPLCGGIGLVEFTADLDHPDFGAVRPCPHCQS